MAKKKAATKAKAKAKAAPPAKVGRPPLAIDERQVLRLAKIQCTHAEIAAVLDCSTDTLTRRFAECIKRGREAGKKSLRRAQFAAALRDRNPTLLIWLGKQHLGQLDKVQQEQTGGLRIVVEYADRDPHAPEAPPGTTADPR